MYGMDLGTMGIPREVAQLNQNYNFLYAGSNSLGPGDYQPDLDKVQKKAPIVSFGKLPGNNKSGHAQWEDKMESYIGVKPSERDKPQPRDKSPSIMQSFEQ